MRDLTPLDLPFAAEVIAADLSFISLRLVVRAFAAVSLLAADLILLVKPQFEAGRADVGRGGVVTDPAVWRRTIAQVAAACVAEGLAPRAVMASPLPGPAGNVEFPLYAVRGGEGASLDLDAAIDEGRRVRGAR